MLIKIELSYRLCNKHFDTSNTFLLFFIKIYNLSISKKGVGRFIQGGMSNAESRIHGKNQKMRQTSLHKHSCLPQ